MFVDPSKQPIQANRYDSTAQLQVDAAIMRRLLSAQPQDNPDLQMPQLFIAEEQILPKGIFVELKAHLHGRALDYIGEYYEDFSVSVSIHDISRSQLHLALTGKSEPLSARFFVHDLKGSENCRLLLGDEMVIRLIGSGGDEILGQQAFTDEAGLELVFLDLSPTQIYRFEITEK